MTMHIRPLQTQDIAAVLRLLHTNGWAHRVADAHALAALVQASQRCAVAVDAQEAPVGFARAITDGLSNGYLSMVVVDAAWRRRGIGRQLVEAVIGADPAVTWVLRAGREGASEFFAALGFEPSTLSMERRRSALPGTAA